MPQVTLSSLVNAPAIRDLMATISGAEYAVSAGDHAQTRFINQATNMVLLFPSTLANGLQFVFWRKNTCSGEVTWGGTAAIVVVPEGPTALDFGFLTAIVENPTGAAATVYLSGALK